MIDRYTKAVLTIIAACLVWNIVTSTNVRPAFAQSYGPAHVIIDGAVWPYAFRYAGPLQVRQ